MAKYLITQAIIYRNKNGDHILVHEGDPTHNCIFNTEDPNRGVDPKSFIPPVLGLEAMDEEALVALKKVRKRHADEVGPGWGEVPKARIVTPDGYFEERRIARKKALK